MKILHFIAVLFCCVSFASASFASVGMVCCMENIAPVTIEHEGSHAMPCHGDTQNSPMQQDDGLQMQSCNCLCALQTVNLPVPELPERIARAATFAAMMPLPPLEFHPPIDAPPKAFS